LVPAEDTFAVDVFELELAKAEFAPLAARVWRCCEALGFSRKTVSCAALCRAVSDPGGVEPEALTIGLKQLTQPKE